MASKKGMTSRLLRSVSIFYWIALLISWVVASPPPAQAAVVLPAVFQDNMVLQRDKPISIWGHAEPGEKITVKLGTESAHTKANDKGGWLVELKPLSAGGPYQLHIQGTNTIDFSNVEIGDVWICGGQSNMTIKLKYSDFNANDLATADRPLVRYFKTDKILSHTVQGSLPGKWLVFNFQSAPEISAIAFHFGRELFDKTAVPIGLIDLSYGGAPIESFLPNAHLPASATGAGMFYTAGVRNGMVLPLFGLRVKGVLWYQGESNLFEAILYSDLLSKLIGDWRGIFQDKLLPFYVVQLPNLSKRVVAPPMTSLAAQMRAAQGNAATIPGVFVTVNIDTNPGTYAEIHSRFKRTIALRLANSVLANSYGLPFPSKFPTLAGVQKIKNQYVLSFNNTQQGLKFTGKLVKGCAVTARNGALVLAYGSISPDRQHLIVWSPVVPDPRGVRYAWADNPEANIYNSDDLPLMPFNAVK
jgi:sialate O-acetylesterase